MNGHPSDRLYNGEIDDPAQALATLVAALRFEAAACERDDPDATDVKYAAQFRADAKRVAELQRRLSHALDAATTAFADTLNESDGLEAVIATALRTHDYTTLAI